MKIAGWSSLAAHLAHNQKIGGSNPSSATNKERQKQKDEAPERGLFVGWLILF